MKSPVENHLALALDNIENKRQIEILIDETAQWIGIYKIGLEQFIRFGPSILNVVRNAKRKMEPLLLLI